MMPDMVANARAGGPYAPRLHIFSLLSPLNLNGKLQVKQSVATPDTRG
jgi:hypothetical protein